MREIQIITKNINQRQQDKNCFFVIVKKASVNKLNKSFMQSMKKYFKIDETSISNIKLETYVNKKVKISFTTNLDRKFDQLTFQQRRFYLNNYRYVIQIETI